MNGRRITGMTAAAFAAAGILGMAAQAGNDNRLIVWCWGPQWNMYAMEQAGELYSEEHPEFELQIVETSWEDIQEKLAAAGESGDFSTLPDLVLVQEDAFGEITGSFPEIFQDLSGSWIDLSLFDEERTAASQADGKQYGLPFGDGVAAAYYRTETLEEAGYTVEDLTDITWERWQEIGMDVLETTGQPLLVTTSGTADLVRLMARSAGGGLTDGAGQADGGESEFADGAVQANLADNEVLAEAIRMYAGLVESGVIVEVNSQEKCLNAMLDGTAVGTMNGSWILGELRQEKGQSGKWAVTDLPSLDGVEGATNYSTTENTSWAVTANCGNTQLALDFLATGFAGEDTELYDDLLENAGLLTAYLPAGESTLYQEPQEFFEEDAVYGKLRTYAEQVPEKEGSGYCPGAGDALAKAVDKIVAGADATEALEQAQSKLEVTDTE